MKREDLGDLAAFLAVVEDGSFTRAAARLGTSQSSLSHTVRRLEDRLGVRLLTRTTRRVAPTTAGEQLAQTLRPAFDDIGARLEQLNALRHKPAGTLRLTSGRDAAKTIVLPAVSRLLADYPDVHVEVSVDQKLVDIVAERYDAGVRLGEQVEKDMVAVRIGPDIRMAVVGSPAYFETHPRPVTPHDLTDHICINLRLSTLGGLYAWEFEKEGRPLNVRVKGAFTVNDGLLALEAATRGVGLACLPDTYLAPGQTGPLVRVLEDWCPPFAGYHLYYPGRRQLSPAFALLVDALRYRG